MPNITTMKVTIIFLFISVSGVIAADEPRQLLKAITQYHHKNICQSLPVFSKLSEENIPEAHYYLGLIYSNNNQAGLYNPRLGYKHFISAANLGHTQSMFQIGLMYDNGISVPKNAFLAIDWYRRSKITEKPSSAKYTFFKENNGTTIEVDYDEIFQDLLSKAECGHAEAQFQVARIYDHGIFIPRDFTKAMAWYQRAADNNYQEAQFMIAYFYCRGIGLERDPESANEWLIKSGHKATCTD